MNRMALGRQLDARGPGVGVELAPAAPRLHVFYAMQ